MWRAHGDWLHHNPTLTQQLQRVRKWQRPPRECFPRVLQAPAGGGGSDEATQPEGKAPTWKSISMSCSPGWVGHALVVTRYRLLVLGLGSALPALTARSAAAARRGDESMMPMTHSGVPGASPPHHTSARMPLSACITRGGPLCGGGERQLIPETARSRQCTVQYT